MNGRSFIDGPFTKGLGWRMGYSRSVPIRFLWLVIDLIWLFIFLFFLLYSIPAFFLFFFPFSPPSPSFFPPFTRLYKEVLSRTMIRSLRIRYLSDALGLEFFLFYAKSIPSRTPPFPPPPPDSQLSVFFVILHARVSFLCFLPFLFPTFRSYGFVSLSSDSLNVRGRYVKEWSVDWILDDGGLSRHSLGDCVSYGISVVILGEIS